MSCFDFTPIELIHSSGRQIFEYSKPKHVQYPYIKQVVEELTGRRNPSNTAISAARTSRVMDEVVSGYYTR
jgi:hypothetical protein